MTSVARIEFVGAFDTDHFAEFAQHRAHRLDLAIRIEAAERDRFSVLVSGEPDLVDAFEMACSLGPLDCLVIDVIRRDGQTGSEGTTHEV